MTETKPTFVNITNREVYDLVQKMNGELQKLKTTLNVVAFVIAPILSAVTSTVAVRIINNA